MVHPVRLLPVILLVSAIGACSSEDSSPPPAEPEGMRAGLAALWAGDEGDPDAADCFADELADRTSPDQLRAGGILDDDRVVTELPVLEPELAEQWVRAQFACVDFVEESTRAQVAASKGRIDQAAYAGCLRTALTEDQVVEAVVATLSGGFGTPEVAALSEAQLTCAQEALPSE